LVACNAALHACAGAGRPAEAKQLLDRMQAAGLAPDVVSYTAAIHACGARRPNSQPPPPQQQQHRQQQQQQQQPQQQHKGGGHHLLALELLLRMQAAGVRPNGITATAAAHACVSAGEWRVALELLRDADASGLLGSSFSRSSRQGRRSNGGQDVSVVAAAIAMRAWLESRHEDGAERALAVLDDLLRPQEEARRATAALGGNGGGDEDADLFDADGNYVDDDDDDNDNDNDYAVGRPSAGSVRGERSDGDVFGAAPLPTSMSSAEELSSSSSSSSSSAVVGPNLLCFQLGLEACALLARPDRALDLVGIMVKHGKHALQRARRLHKVMHDP
jgi:pentatricopeptide repeat protein